MPGAKTAYLDVVLGVDPGGHHQKVLATGRWRTPTVMGWDAGLHASVERLVLDPLDSDERKAAHESSAQFNRSTSGEMETVAGFDAPRRGRPPSTRRASDCPLRGRQDPAEGQRPCRHSVRPDVHGDLLHRAGRGQDKG